MYGEFEGHCSYPAIIFIIDCSNCSETKSINQRNDKLRTEVLILTVLNNMILIMARIKILDTHIKLYIQKLIYLFSIVMLLRLPL